MFERGDLMELLNNVIRALHVRAAESGGVYPKKWLVTEEMYAMLEGEAEQWCARHNRRYEDRPFTICGVAIEKL